MNASVGTLLVARRTDLGHSQRAAAETIGVSQATVARWEEGGGVAVRHRPTIARYLDRETRELFNDSDDPVEAEARLARLEDQVATLSAQLAALKELLEMVAADADIVGPDDPRRD